MGMRFRREIVLTLRSTILSTLSVTVALLLLALGIALVLQTCFGFDFATALLAVAPGGVAEMSLTAAALGVGVPAVIAFHLVRVLMIVLLSAPLHAVLDRPRNR